MNSQDTLMPREIWAWPRFPDLKCVDGGWLDMDTTKIPKAALSTQYTRTDFVEELVAAVLAVKGHDKIDPDEAECPIRWDEWAHIREKLIAEILRLAAAFREQT